MLENFQYTQPPFSFLTTAQKQFLKIRLNTCRYLQGERIALLERSVPVVYLLVEGQVEKRSLTDKKVLQTYNKNDVLILPANRSQEQQKYEFFVTDNLRCYQLRDEAFQQLCLENPAFAAWFSQGDASGSISLNFAHSASFMLAPIGEESFAPLCELSGDQSILDGAQCMRTHGVKTLLVKLGKNKEGLLTLSDLFWALTLDQHTLETPLSALVQESLQTVDYNGLLFHAMLTMAKNQQQRVVVKDGDETRGLIELPLLMHKFFPNPPSFAFQVQKASTVEALTQCAQDVDQFLRKLATHQLSLPYLMPVARVLNDALLRKAFTLSFPADLAEKICLIVMGPEGRGERILACEPAHALILDNSLDSAHIMQYCRQFHETLNGLNYYFGEKAISLMDPQWVKPIENWEQNIHFWCQNVSAQGRHHVSLFQDARAIAGESTYLELVRAYLLDPSKSYPDLIEQQFNDICSLETPLTVLGGIKASSVGLNLQETALNPILSGIRSLALLHHLDVGSTFERLEQLTAIHAISKSFADDLKQAFELFYVFDLQIQAHQEGVATTAVLNPDRISKHERDKLRMAYHTVRQFKQWLRQQSKQSYAS